MSGSVGSIPEGQWRSLALCAGHPDRDCWFPDDYSNSAADRAVATCRACPVRAECLDFAINTHQSEGVWGGMTPSQRRRLVRARRKENLAN